MSFWREISARVLPPRIVLGITCLDFVGSTTKFALSESNRSTNGCALVPLKELQRLPSNKHPSSPLKRNPRNRRFIMLNFRPQKHPSYCSIQNCNHVFLVGNYTNEGWTHMAQIKTGPYYQSHCISLGQKFFSAAGVLPPEHYSFIRTLKGYHSQWLMSRNRVFPFFLWWNNCCRITLY